MTDLTVDVCVLVSANTPNDSGLCCDCSQLLNRMRTDQTYVLAIDERGKIAEQYKRKCRNGTVGHHFFINMVGQNRCVNVPWIPLNRQVRAQLEGMGFTRDNEDYKYLVVAQGTSCRTIATHDPHFTNASAVLGRVPIRVVQPSLA